MSGTFQNSLLITSETRNLQRVRAFLGECIVRSGYVPAEWQNKITLAVDEAVSNIIEHAYDKEEHGQQGEINIVIEATHERFEIVIIDSGKEFDPDTIPEVDISTHVQAGRKSGLGIFLMRRIMDEVRYTFKEGIKNELRMVKYFRKK